MSLWIYELTIWYNIYNMAKFELKEKVFALRRKGESVGNIAKKFHLSKGTVSVWCSAVHLTDFQIKRLRDKVIAAGHRGRLLGSEKNRQIKLENIKVANEWAINELGKISTRDLLIAGTAIYWGEGSKTRGPVSFINSDQSMVKFIRDWLRIIFGVDDDDFFPRVLINEIHKPRIKKVLKFWSNLLRLPISQFRKTIFIKTKQKKVYSNYDNYYGLLSLRVRKSTMIKYKILGLIEVLRGRSSSGS